MRLLPFAPLLLALVPASADRGLRDRLGAAEMRAVPVAIDTSDASRQRLGALTYLGGVRLSSRDPAFGGFSAMRVEGDRFTLLSDSGNLVRFRMGADFRTRDVSFGELPAGPGTGAYKWQRDSESLAWEPDTGRVWIGFENRNMIWRYDHDISHAQRHAAPPAMADWARAGGPEAMARLRDGRFVVMSETSRPKGMRDARLGLRFAGDPTETGEPPLPFAYVPPRGYDPTEMAELPDGRLLVLNRRLSLRGLFTACITLIDLRGVPAGGRVEGIEIARFERPVLHDNFEAMAVTREGEDVILWIASDDNGQFWEASLLLKFRIEYARAAARGAR